MGLLMEKSFDSMIEFNNVIEKINNNFIKNILMILY